MPLLKAENRKIFLPNTSNDWTGDFTFIQAADCQLGMEWANGKGSWGYGQGHGYADDVYCNSTWIHETRWCNSMVQMINAMNPPPKFAIMCGDMLDAWPDRGETLLNVRNAQYRDFVDIFSSLNVPLICVCGNHDVGPSPTQETVTKYRSDFGDEWFSFECNGLFCIVINSQYYEDAQHVPEIALEQEQWLEEQLKIVSSGKHQHSVLFQHIPWFLNKPDEEKVYYNFPQPLRENMLNKFQKAGISKIFCGHYHKNAGGWYKDMELVVTSAIGLQQGNDKNGFRVVTVKENQIDHKYVELDNIDP